MRTEITRRFVVAAMVAVLFSVLMGSRLTARQLASPPLAQSVVARNTIGSAKALPTSPPTVPGLPSGGTWARTPRPGGEAWSYQFTVAPASTALQQAPGSGSDQPSGAGSIEAQSIVAGADRGAAVDPGADIERLIQPRFTTDADLDYPNDPDAVVVAGQPAAAAASSRASDWTSIAGHLAAQTRLSGSTDGKAGLSAFEFNVDDIKDNLEVASARVSLKVTHPAADQLTIWLAAGTRQILLWSGTATTDEPNAATGSTLTIDRIIDKELSGVPISGRWTLYVSDRSEGSTGVLEGASVVIEAKPYDAGIAGTALTNSDPTLDIEALEAYMRTGMGSGSGLVSSPVVGQTVYFTLGWRVTGSGSTGLFAVRAVLDGATYCSYSVGASAGPIWTSWCDTGWVATAGSHLLTWDLDYTDLVPETSESNNSQSRLFTSWASIDIMARSAYLLTVQGGPHSGGSEVVTPAVGQTVYFYVDFDVIGSGNGVVFSQRALLDGSLYCTIQNLYTSQGSHLSWCSDPWVATAGSHTLTWEMDYLNEVAESDEGNNTAGRSFGPSSGVDLAAESSYLRTAPYSGSFVVTPTVGQTVYFHLDYQIIGSGSPVPYSVRAVLDGATYCTLAFTGPLGTAWATYCSNGWVVTAGAHTLTWDLDYDNQVTETDESNNSTTRSYTSAVTSVTLGSSTASTGGPISFSVVDGPALNTDWVGLYLNGAGDGAWVDWQYLNKRKTLPSSGVSSATLNFTAPATPGTYEVRLFSSSTRIATSGLVTVQAQPTLSINDVSVAEGSSGTSVAAFTVSLTPVNTTQAVTVAYATANGTATAGSDYVAATGTLTFAPSTTAQTISVTINGDTASESNENFVVNLSGATNAIIGDAQGQGTITNDDVPPPPIVTMNTASVISGGAISVSVANGPANPTDWVALVATAGADNAFVDWKYLNGTRTPPGTGLSSATVQFTAPATPGGYNVRFFSNNGFTRLATSGTVTVTGTGTWQRLTHTPAFAASTCELLTDGTVMCQGIESPQWWRLTPDLSGSYVNGTWAQMASTSISYGPLYYASAVLADGRLVIIGGEYNLSGNPVWSNRGAIYNPATNTWATLAAPSGWTTIGDAQSVVLPNGQFLLAHPADQQIAVLNPSTLTWTTVGTGKADRNDEEGWNLLPDGTVLTIDATNGTHAEKYVISSGQWVSAGSTVVSLVDAGSEEIGPAVLRPDGTTFAMGGTGHTSIYTRGANPTDAGSWIAGPDFPIVNGSQLTVADGPASILPNGNVLVGASPGVFQSNTRFFEFDGATLAPVAAPPRAPFISSYYGRMLVLPTGQVLFTDGSNDVEIYTSPGSANSAWAPTISSVPGTVQAGGTFVVSGTQFNGVSQGASYGDDAQSATNYPLVRITNQATGHVFYARTHDHSTMGVATGTASVSTSFDVPAGIELGVSTIQVVANGIPSASAAITVTEPNPPTLTVSATTLPLKTSDRFQTTFGNGPGNSGEWVGLYPAGTTGSAGYVDWQWMTGGQSVRGALTGGTLSFPTPGRVLALGTYVLRWISAAGTVLATSPTLTVVNPVPTIFVLVPETVTAGSPAFTLTVVATNRVPGAVVQVNGVSRPTTSASGTTLTAEIPASDVATTGANPAITVFNPAPGGGASSPLTLTVTAPPAAPTISSLSPTSVPTGGYPFVLFVTGTNFAPASVIQVNGQTRQTSFASSTSVTTTLLESDRASAGTLAITVLTPPPGGGTSNQATLTITAPTITAASAIVAPGAAIGFSVAGGPGVATDWVALYAGTAADNTFVDWMYLNGLKTLPNIALSDATLQFTAPAIPGTYNIRLFAHNLFTKLATSGAVVVQPPPTLTINDVSMTEGDIGTRTATFTVTMSPPNPSQTVTVDYTTTNGTATAGSDYVTTSGTLTLGGPVDNQPISVTINSDAINESNETFVVTLSNAVNAIIGDSQGVGTILNDDAPPGPAVTINTPSVSPGGTISVSVANGPANATDWVALFSTTATDTTYIDWIYLNGTRTPTTGVSSATLQFTAPATTGTYNVRLFSNNSFTKIATSGAATVLPPSLTINGPSVSVGHPMGFSLASGPANPADWVGLFVLNSSDAAYVDWMYLNGTRTAPGTGLSSASLQFIAPSTPGLIYEIRLFSNNTFTRLATSGAFTVAP